MASNPHKAPIIFITPFIPFSAFSAFIPPIILTVAPSNSNDADMPISAIDNEPNFIVPAPTLEDKIESTSTNATIPARTPTIAARTLNEVHNLSLGTNDNAIKQPTNIAIDFAISFIPLALILNACALKTLEKLYLSDDFEMEDFEEIKKRIH